MKILILRFSSIGDIVLTTPVVRCIKKQYPEAEVHFVTKKAFSPIVQTNPYISKVHLLNDSLMDLVNELKQEKFDYVIDLHHNQRTFILKTMLGVKAYSFNKLNFEKWLMVNFKINRLPQKHIVDRYLETCAPLGVVNDVAGLDYFIPEDDKVDTTDLPEGCHKGYVAWVIGAKQHTKKFPVDKVALAIGKLNYPVVLLGGKEDIAEGESIAQLAVINNPAVYNVAGKFTLNQSASVVQQARLVVTNDTGLMHIAAALKKPIISIWGNTIPGFGMGPYYGNAKVKHYKFEIEGLSCRPCSKLGYEQCPKGHFKCMREMDEAAIAATIEQCFA